MTERIRKIKERKKESVTQVKRRISSLKRKSRQIRKRKKILCEKQDWGAHGPLRR